MYIYIYIYTHTHIYIYIEREGCGGGEHNLVVGDGGERVGEGRLPSPRHVAQVGVPLPNVLTKKIYFEYLRV